ncbi:ubiquitin carboxyl-terminal hydrolase 22 [Onthophagus taurus]|uniref:ubiquitin carboxyl-terminal hydrolase 22 n=1 Tax=Onthophagus taurus TaxID=166361 RepID=UPI000C2015C8|nr:ubiquitin carboxyl-terminal hydrolase 22 [Onthophagus taurus]
MDYPKGTCPHLPLVRDEILSVYKKIYKIFVASTSSKEKSIKIENRRCQDCNTLQHHLHTCAHCVYFGCQQHVRTHSSTFGHMFSVELTFGQLYCLKCGDYVYEAALDKIAFELKLSASSCKKRLFNWSFFQCNDENGDLLKFTPKRVCIPPESTIGLRGLLNLGNTCFMNCIIQSFMHMPLLREYFLTERHKCTRSPNSCLVCELAKLFQDFYSGMTTPISLHKMLHLIWTQATHLAGYEQQDAHEFFIAMLHVLQEHDVTGTQDSPPKRSIIDQIFSGLLQSDVVCKKCKSVSTKIEAMKDVSLDLGQVSGGRPPQDIQECLERFTRVEDLGAKIMCSNCNSHQESTKQLSMKTLPIVVCFHLKRFQHFKKGEKISTPISFPETLDMTPFMSKTNNRATELSSDNKYSLFTVINHDGNMINSGHYTAYVRQQQEYWYKCSDRMITMANIEDVLKSEAYLLFYHKSILLYD